MREKSPEAGQIKMQPNPAHCKLGSLLYRLIHPDGDGAERSPVSIFPLEREREEPERLLATLVEIAQILDIYQIMLAAVPFPETQASPPQSHASNQ